MILTPIDMFVYGAVAAMTGNSGKAQIVSLDSITEATGLRNLQIIVSLKSIQRSGLLDVVFVNDQVCLHVGHITQSLLTQEILRSAA